MDDGKSLPVVAVGVRTELMFDLMSLEIRQAADLQDAVFRHRGIPHQVAAGLHIIDVSEQTAHVDDRIAHDRQRDIIRDIVFI